MSVALAPPMFLQFMNPNNSGAPAAGFKLFTYVGGTTTKQATWTDATQTVQNPNPLTLDSNGCATTASGTQIWGDPSLTFKFVLAGPNDTDPPTSPLRTTDNLQFPVTAATAGALQFFFPQIPAEAAAGITPTSYNYAPGDVRRYGADGTGAADSSPAFNAAFSIVGINCTIPLGNFKIAANLNTPQCASILGAGVAFPTGSLSGAVIRPTAAVTQLLSITSGGNWPEEIGRFAIDGSLTTNAKALVLGSTAATHVYCHDIVIGNFTGGTGYGLVVADTIQTLVQNIYTFNCDVGCLCNGDAGFPTTTKFVNCEFDLSPTAQGCLIQTAFELDFDCCIFQSNKQEGVRIAPGSGATVKGVNFRKSWTENNWLANSPTSNYDFVIAPNNSATSCTVVIEYPFFNSGGGAPLCVNATGSQADVIIRTPQFAAAVSNSIIYQSSAFGRIEGWDNFWSYNTIVSDAGAKVIGWEGALNNWSPTLTFSGGTAAVTSPTITLARWRRVGVNMLFVEWNVSGSSTGSGGVYLNLTLPAGFTLQGTSVRLPCLVTDNTEQLGAMLTDGSSNIRFYKANTVNYTAAASIGSSGQALLEVTG